MEDLELTREQNNALHYHVTPVQGKMGFRVWCVKPNCFDKGDPSVRPAIRLAKPKS